jgi:transcriptional regulator with XRE-family HTH domain
MESLRQAIIAARKEKGISVREVSRVTGIPHGTLYNYEYGRRFLSMDKVVRYADAIGYKVTVSITEQ